MNLRASHLWVLLVLTSLSTGNLWGQTVVKDARMIAGLKGKVKSLKSEEFTLTEKFGNVERGVVTWRTIEEYSLEGWNQYSLSYTSLDQPFDREYRTTRKFNKAGYEISGEIADANGEIVGSYNKDYSVADQFLTITRKDYNPDQSLNQLSTERIDTSNGKKEISIYSGSDGSLSMKIYSEYDNLGRPISQVAYDGSGRLSNKFVWAYGPNGVLSRLRTREQLGLQISENTVWEYGDDGFVKDEKEFNFDGSPKSLTRYKNDGEGNPIEKTKYLVTEQFGGSIETPTSQDLIVYEYWE